MARRSQTLWNSEDYYADALAAMNDEWIFYNPKEDLDSWLEANPPSKFSRSNGIGWIGMVKEGSDEDSDKSSDAGQDNDSSLDTDHGIAELQRDWEVLKQSGDPINFHSICNLVKKHSDRSSDVHEDSDGSSDTDHDIADLQLQQDWKDLKNSGEPVNFESISQLAKKHNATAGGGWLFHVETGYKVDFLWSQMAKEFTSGVLADVVTSMFVSPLNPRMHESSHVIIVNHHCDFTNEADVFKLENAIRLAGVKTKLRYKPGIFADLGIYRNNEFNIRPTIYTSHYDALKKKSTIIRNF